MSDVMEIDLVKRESAKLILGLAGETGEGKTYTALMKRYHDMVEARNVKIEKLEKQVKEQGDKAAAFSIGLLSTGRQLGRLEALRELVTPQV